MFLHLFNVLTIRYGQYGQQESIEVDGLLALIFGIVFLVCVIIIIILNVTYKQKPVTEVEGKLVRKAIYESPKYTHGMRGTRRYWHYIRFLTFQERNPNPVDQYYLAFRTKQGVKSFTVHFDTFNAINMKDKGIIKHKGTRFISFTKK